MVNCRYFPPQIHLQIVTNNTKQIIRIHTKFQCNNQNEKKEQLAKFFVYFQTKQSTFFKCFNAFLFLRDFE